MYQTKELSIEEYEKALKDTKKEDVISICLHHIKRTRYLESILKEDNLWKELVDFHCSPYLMTKDERHSIKLLNLTKEELQTVIDIIINYEKT